MPFAVDVDVAIDDDDDDDDDMSDTSFFVEVRCDLPRPSRAARGVAVRGQRRTIVRRESFATGGGWYEDDPSILLRTK
jgi:hypothetical protein